MREALQQWKARFRLRRWDRDSCRPPRQMTGKNACPTELILCALAAPEFEELAEGGGGTDDSDGMKSGECTRGACCAIRSRLP